MDANYQKEPVNIWPSVAKFLIITFYSILTLGIFTNISVFITVIRVMKILKNNLPDKHMLVYILALSLVDCLVLLNIPLIISDMINEGWIFGELLCKFHYIGDNINKIMSTIILTTLSFDRYLTVCHPYSILHWKSVKVTVLILFGSFVGGIGLLSPLMFSTGLNTIYLEENMLTKCSYLEPDDNIEQSYFYVMFGVGYCIPLILMTFFHARILVSLHRNGKRLRKSRMLNDRRRDNIQKVTRRMILVIVFYFICWTPYWTVNLYIQATHRQSSNNLTFQVEPAFAQPGNTSMPLMHPPTMGAEGWIPAICLVLYFLVYANSAINPFIYGIFNCELQRQCHRAWEKQAKSADHWLNVQQDGSLFHSLLAKPCPASAPPMLAHNGVCSSNGSLHGTSSLLLKTPSYDCCKEAANGHCHEIVMNDFSSVLL